MASASDRSVLTFHPLPRFICSVLAWEPRYDERMKSTPNTKTFRRFTAAMQAIMTVSKTELLAREKQAKEERKAKRSSASDHASRSND
jgi:hypothetical protein